MINVIESKVVINNILFSIRFFLYYYEMALNKASLRSKLLSRTTLQEEPLNKPAQKLHRHNVVNPSKKRESISLIQMMP